MAAENILKMEQCSQDMNANVDVLFFINLILDLIYSCFLFVCGHFKVIFLYLGLMLLVYILYKSYWSPVFYGRTSVVESTSPEDAPVAELKVHRVCLSSQCSAAWFWWWFLFCVLELSSLGYDHLPRKDRALHIIRTQNNAKFGNKFPPPYPNGWFDLVESRDLSVGGVIPIDALGLNLCVYRGEDGIARVVDAYCPHLGANLGVGGTVRGNCIECPFHQWRFGEDGACFNIPGMESVPKGISIKTYHSMEVDGAVWVWYHVDGEPPLWTVEELEELKSWSYRGRNEFLIKAHIQEIPENGADLAHLNAVHNISMFSTLGFKYPFINQIIGHHTWSSVWEKGHDHLAHITIIQQYIFMKMNVLPLTVTGYQVGPGHVRLTFTSPVGPMGVIQTVTPLGPLLQKVVHRMYSPYYNAPLAAGLVFVVGYQFQRDVAIWNNKRYLDAPVYANAKCDKSIRTFRSWFNQFYSKNSISFKDAMQNPLDW